MLRDIRPLAPLVGVPALATERALLDEPEEAHVASTGARETRVLRTEA